MDARPRGRLGGRARDRARRRGGVGVPAAPERSVVNSVVVRGPGRAARPYDELAAAYEGRLDRVGARPRRARRQALLDRARARAGRRPRGDGARPRRGSSGRRSRPRSTPRRTRARSARSTTRPTARRAPSRGRWRSSRRATGCTRYTAGPGSCLLTIDHEEDCSVWFVATVPAARGQGLATALMAHALADGRERGCTTLHCSRPRTSAAPSTSGSATASLGEIQMWERAGRAERLRPSETRLVEHDLALQRAVHRALGDDRHQLLPLLLGQLLRQLHVHLELRGRAALGGLVVHVHHHLADVPALAVGVHLHRDRAAGGQAGGQQLLRARAGVGPAVLLGLVGGQLGGRRSPRGASGCRPTRRATALMAISAAPLEQLGRVLVGEARHRVHGVGGAVEVGQHGVVGQRRARSPSAPRRRTAARATSSRADSSVPPGITNLGGSSTRSM